jgi:ribosomal protein RSM22 (predicted rRNA methylase)
MPQLEQDLTGWMPRLIAAWRKLGHHRGGPRDELAPAELRKVAAGVRRLSAGLTRDRTLAGSAYLDDPELLGAYLLFYWPISYAQARQIFAELDHRPGKVLDLGSGPAPVAFAALDAGAAEAIAADRSRQALALARELAGEAGEGLATREWNSKPGRSSLDARLCEPQQRFDLIAFGHVLNELFGAGEAAVSSRAALVEETLGRLRPNGSVVIIEPALRETSRALLQLRDALVARGYAVRAPCFYRGNCPALLKGSDWCHADRDWRRPPLVEAIARAAGLHRDSLKMSYLVLAPRGEAWSDPPSGRIFRIVSEPLAGKGRRRFIGCGPEGRLGLALQEKHRSEHNQAFFRLQRGDVARISEAEPRGDGLALGEHSEISVLAPAGHPVPGPHPRPP